MTKFGLHAVKDGLAIKFREEKLTLEKAGGDSYLYRREHEGETAAERLFSSDGGNVQLAVYPVRPIQVPQQLAHHIMIKLNPPVSIPPGSQVTHNLTMPIEIGVFTTSSETSNYLIDAFSLSSPKYALYGLPESGYICRLHKSGLNQKADSIKHEEATIIMRFENNLQDWVTVSKIVMDAYMVDLYLKGDTVYLEDSNIVVEDENTASVYLNNNPPLPGLEEVPMAAETVKKFRLSILERTGFGVAGKFTMEYGY